MPHRRVRSIVDELQQELAERDDLSREDLADLKALLVNVRDVVDDDSESDGESVLADMRDVTARFESTHPRLTKTLLTISELLRGLGIS